MTLPPSPPRTLFWIYPQVLESGLHMTPKIEMTRQLRRMGWQVILVTAKPTRQNHLHAVDIDVIHLPRPQVYFLGQIVFHLRLLALLQRQWAQIDFIYFQQISALWLLPLWLLRQARRKRRPLFVMDTRTVPMEDWASAGWKIRLRAIYHRWMSRLANRWADGQTAITRRMAQAGGIPRQKLWGVWPSGVSLEHYTGAAAARRWPGPDDPLILIYVGALEKERRLEALVQAVAQANREGLCFRLWIVGDGRDRLDLERAAAGTQGAVQVLPPVPNRQVPELLAQAHIGALPFPDEPKFQVSSPIKLFEYLAAGLPILATRVVCHTDVLGARPCAFWAADDSPAALLAALRAAWQDRARLPDMGRKSLQAAPEWDWQPAARKLRAALERGWQAARPEAHG